MENNSQQIIGRNIFLIAVFLLPFWPVCRAAANSGNCQLNASDPIGVAYTITVSPSGRGKFTTIQSAIDSVPLHNTRWIRVKISPGIYVEKVTIPEDKPCIYLKGAGRQYTSIIYGDHQQTDTSATFTSFAPDIVAKDIAFKNNYNVPRDDLDGNSTIRQALAARIYGDRSAFYRCAFISLQDTLWDATGRHYFSNCYFEGGIDFIFGSGQSIYVKCNILLNLGKYDPQASAGFITAQSRSSTHDPSGFVFKFCVIHGVGKTYLGRAYGAYSRVIFYKSSFGDVIVPAGWDAWTYGGKEQNFDYVEWGNVGPGANTSQRVPWLTKPSWKQLRRFVLMNSYINQDGWMEKLPKN